MKKIWEKKIILFDLDGTITDSYPAITSSFLYATSDYGISFSEDDLASIIGPPLKESFMRLLGVDGFEGWELVKKYREFYNAGGIFDCKVYSGMEDLLSSLNMAGKTLVVATSKPEDKAVRVLRHFGLDKEFKLIVGDDQECTRANKEDIIQLVLEKLGNPNADDVVMIGDRRYDVTGAKKFSITAVGVTFGYGGMKELMESGANYIVNNVKELKELLLNEKI